MTRSFGALLAIAIGIVGCGSSNTAPFAPSHDASANVTDANVGTNDDAGDATFVDVHEGGAFDAAGDAGPFLVTAIAAGSDHACAVAGGATWCWGSSIDGALGVVPSATPDCGILKCSPTPLRVAGAPANATQLALGANFGCALDPTGHVWCWGTNSSGQLGAPVTTKCTGSTVNCSTTPVQAGISGVSAIAAGTSFMCAIVSGGVQCWGSNAAGQLGNGSTTSSSTPVAVPGLSGVTAIGLGASHACAVLSSGAIECWGANDYGQLGATTTATCGSIPCSMSPVAVTGISGAKAVAGGWQSTCATLSSGARCWGSNAVGQLGNGTLNDSASPVTVTGLTGTSAIASGNGAESVCVLVDGAVQCWGDDDTGQLGISSPAMCGIENCSETPVPAEGVSGVVTSVAVGGAGAQGFTCALLASGSLTCWGLNSEGTLGLGTTSDSEAASIVKFPSGSDDGGITIANCPGPTTNYAPTAYASVTSGAGVCSESQVDAFIAACGDNGNATSCNAWLSSNVGNPFGGTACGNCVFASGNAGPVWTDANNVFSPHFGACLQLVDPAHRTACPAAYDALAGCEAFACDACNDSTGACTNAADQGSCASYLAAAQSACATELGAGGEGLACLPQEGYDPSYQEFITIMCGGGSNGAGDFSDAGVNLCPGSIAGYTPQTFVPSVANQGRCSAADIAAYAAACGAAGNQADCSTWVTANAPSSTSAGTTCGACVYDANNNGPFRTDIKGDTFSDVAACLQFENATNGPSCAAAYDHLVDCEATACDSCEDFVFFSWCKAQVDDGACASYFSAMTSACAADADGGAASCIASTADPTYLVTLLCGGGDAGAQ